MSYKNNKLQERSSREEIVQRMIAVLSLKRKKQLADKLKIRQDNISKFITRNDRSFYKIIIDFAENFNSSVDWLLTGEEPSGRSTAIYENQSEYSKTDNTGTIREPDQTIGTSKAFPSIRIPIVTIAGANTDLGGTAFYPCEQPYEYKTVENCRSVEVSGDSMSPAIMDGQAAIYSKEDSVKNGDLAFAILTDGSQLIKKYHKDEKSGMIMFQSINPRDNEQVLTKEKEIRELYKVVGVLF